MGSASTEVFVVAEAAGGVVGSGLVPGRHTAAAQTGAAVGKADVSAAGPFPDGAFAPVTEELTAFDLNVTGRIPHDLDGRYLRNGPNALGLEDVQAHHCVQHPGDPVQGPHPGAAGGRTLPYELDGELDTLRPYAPGTMCGTS